MKHSEGAKTLIKKSRKLLLVPSPLWNGCTYIGYSHLVKVGDGLSDVQKITKKGSEELLDKDLKRISKQLSKKITKDLTQNQFDALVSLVYDIGIKSYTASGLEDIINNGTTDEVINKFRTWNRYKKAPIYQLLKARKMEIELFQKPL